MYTAFASVYDALMRGVDYTAWAGFYVSLLKERGVEDGAQVAECACGTGGLTLPLSARYRMTGVDLSEDMLSIAMGKARDAGRSIRFVKQDMAALLLHKPQDAVLATCDGLNYLTTEKQAAGFFASAYRALKPGGALAFDLSTAYKLEHVLGDRLLIDETEGLCCYWQNGWEGARRRAHMRLDIFALESGGLWRRITEDQVQQAWTPDELIPAMEKAGFAGIRIYGDQRRAYGPREERIHISAIRP